MQPGEPHPSLTLALKRLLRPLVRVLIAQNVTFPALTRLLKEVYVEVADADFQIPGKPQTDSRVNLLTGIHRKDVRALRQSKRVQDAPPPVLSRNAHMIALWMGKPDYLDARGQPRALPRNAASDGSPSFEGLVGSVSKDIRSRAVLDEWLRLELVSLSEDGLVQLNAAAFVPRDDYADLAFYFGRNLRDHIAASGHNLLGRDPPMLEQAVYHEKLAPGSVAEIAALARRLSKDALREINQKAFELSQKDETASDAEQRITFGLYFYSAPDDDAETGED
jgi:hypothetical protein